MKRDSDAERNWKSKDLHSEDRTKGDRWDSVTEQTFSLQGKVRVKGSESWVDLDP